MSLFDLQGKEVPNSNSPTDSNLSALLCDGSNSEVSLLLCR
jgi:hypothetical protein